MARTEARILTSIWDDPDFIELPSGEQWMYFALLSQRDLSMCGVLSDTPQRWAHLAKEVTPRAVGARCHGLVTSKFLLRDEATCEVLLRTFVRHGQVLQSANLTVSMARAYCAVHSKVIRKGILDELSKGFPEGVLEGFHQGFDKPNQKPFAERLPKDFLDAVHGLCT